MQDNISMHLMTAATAVAAATAAAAAKATVTANDNDVGSSGDGGNSGIEDHGGVMGNLFQYCVTGTESVTLTSGPGCELVRISGN